MTVVRTYLIIVYNVKVAIVESRYEIHNDVDQEH